MWRCGVRGGGDVNEWGLWADDFISVRVAQIHSNRMTPHHDDM